MKMFRVLFIGVCLAFSNNLKAQTTAIPDPNFEEYLETHAQDGSLVNLGDPNSMGDGIANNALVFTERIESITTLNIADLNIQDITGIEDFIGLEILVANNNRIEQIDISNNINLTLLNVSDNRLLGELVVTNNINLENLFCSSNQIDQLNLESNTILKNLNVSNNALVTLDLSGLNTLVCPDPQTNPVTLCQGTSSINVARNQLVSLIVNNSFNDLISLFDASDNPDLFCIQIDVDFTPQGWIKDDWTYYSDALCVDIFTYVPDDNFEQSLINDGLDDVLDNFVLTADIIALTALDVSNESISDLTGIEDFTALQNLNCSTNVLDTVDFSNNTNLIVLDITNNNLQDLDVQANTQLESLFCSNNFIEEMALDANINLVTLNCSNNGLTYLDVGVNEFLNDLDCSFNQIEQLDVSALPNLVSVLANDNNFFAINIANGNNAAITTLDISNNNNLFCIEVDDVAFANTAPGWQKDAMADYNINCGTYVPDDNFEQALIDQGIDSDNTLNNYVPTADINNLLNLDISGLGIMDLTGIQDFIGLQNLNCANNQLQELDLSPNIALQVLDASINQIVEFSAITNVLLTTVIFNDNALTQLDVANGNNANLVTFNAENNPNLFCINIDGALIGAIPPAWLKDDFADYNDDCINNRFTIIPDPFFEQALIDQGFDNVIDGQVLTSGIEQIQNLNISDKGISDLTGLRDFKSLVELDCSSNFLDQLDVSEMLFLERLNCSSNFLQTNDINNIDGLFNTTGTISLRELFCADNNLNDLDTSQQINLEVLDCANNDLAALQVDTNLNLQRINCSNNNLVTLDISANLALETFNADSNQLTNLITAAAPNNILVEFSCADNDLNEILVNNYSGMQVLNCGSNQLTQLNVLANSALFSMNLTNNQISDIDVSNNLYLETLLLSQNELSALDVSANSALIHLNCNFNNLITSIDVTSNMGLERLYVSSNQLTELNLTSNTNLIDLDASSNDIGQLILPVNLNSLKVLNLSNNFIEGPLDLSGFAISACEFQPNQAEYCPENIAINLSNNLFDFVNIQNGINAEMLNFNTTGNPNLECIQVDDADTIPAAWLKDDATVYSLDCNYGETFVPDDNFEQALIDLGLDTAPLNDFVPTVNIIGYVDLDVSSRAISDLTGIEDFESLEVLNVSNNNLDEIDLSQNVDLAILNCANNQITDLDLSQNTLLTVLDCSENGISELDLSGNTGLSELNIAANLFTEFFPNEVLSLEVFSCYNNAIAELNFQNNEAIRSINCSSNLLEILNVRNGENAILLALNAQNNPNLVCVETDDGTIPAGATWLIDATAQFAVECFFGQTFVPDDNFEQALIDLGYDTLPLDDYVPTENVESVTFLNVSGREIEDLTGIEGFISLSSLNIQDNFVSQLDLSFNTQLSDLNASENDLTDLDVSVLSELTDLDLGDNQITEINLSANLNLIDLDVSNNSLATLDIGLLVNLEDLICASNQLVALDVTQNPNIRLLSCQSNEFIADQLNLQNGNNENLQLFNATNNPNLNCILVDDPVAVINNEDGFYDNWFKDESATYQTVCSDADNDGIPNAEDQCPNTPFGVPVDLLGCAIPNLPIDNFTVSVTSETCLNSNNGQITIVAQELYSYTATLTSDDFSQVYNFTNDIDIFNLLAGTYNLCITIEEWPDYEICYTLVITQPDPLEVFSNRIASSIDLALTLSGSGKYNIELNGDVFTIYDSEVILQLKEGQNHLKVSTDLDCQGIFEERIIVADQMMLYPNPVQDILSIHHPIKNEDINVRLYNLQGQLLATKTYANISSEISFDMSGYISGIYVLEVQSNTMSLTQRIIKL